MAQLSTRVAQCYLIAMSNLVSKWTGVDGAVIWVSAGEFEGKQGQHGPRVKVVVGAKVTREGLDNAAVIKLTDPPEVIGQLPARVKKNALAFVAANRDLLLDYWNLRIDTISMTQQLVRVGTKKSG